MAEFKLLSVERQNKLLNSWSDSEPYVLTYEKKAWYYFGGTRTVKSVVNVPDSQMSSWLERVRSKIGIWRKN